MKITLDLRSFQTNCLKANDLIYLIFLFHNIPLDQLQEESFDISKYRHLEEEGWVKEGLTGHILRQKALEMLSKLGEIQFDLQSTKEDLFKPFFELYPRSVVGPNGVLRILRPENAEGKMYDKLKSSYLRKINNKKAQQEKSIQGLKAHLEHLKKTNGSKYLQLLQTYISDASWEMYVGDMPQESAPINEESL